MDGFEVQLLSSVDALITDARGAIESGFLDRALQSLIDAQSQLEILFVEARSRILKIDDHILERALCVYFHYPRCWDTTAYPTIYHAATEHAYQCSTCGERFGPHNAHFLGAAPSPSTANLAKDEASRRHPGGHLEDGGA